MCVPVLTKTGNYFLSKTSESINQSIGMQEWICANESDYIKKAINFSKDFNSLQKTRDYLIKNRESPSVFKIFDVNSKCYVDWQDVGEEIKSGEFVSHDAKTIDEYIEIYLHAFISLEIPVVVETHAFNDLGELIKVCEHHID